MDGVIGTRSVTAWAVTADQPGEGAVDGLAVASCRNRSGSVSGRTPRLPSAARSRCGAGLQSFGVKQPGRG